MHLADLPSTCLNDPPPTLEEAGKRRMGGSVSCVLFYWLTLVENHGEIKMTRDKRALACRTGGTTTAQQLTAYGLP